MEFIDFINLIFEQMIDCCDVPLHIVKINECDFGKGLKGFKLVVNNFTGMEIQSNFLICTPKEFVG